MRFWPGPRWEDGARYWAARWGWRRITVTWLALGFVFGFAAVLLFC